MHPTPVANPTRIGGRLPRVLERMTEAGRPVFVLGNSSASAIKTHLPIHGLDATAAHVCGRDPRDARG